MTDPSVPQADELVKEISGLLESDNHAVRASSVETLVGFTKYGKFAVPFDYFFLTEFLLRCLAEDCDSIAIPVS
jgi:hypothetical protein